MKNEPNISQNQSTTIEDDNVLFTSILGSIVSLLVAVFVSLNKRNNPSSSSSSSPSSSRNPNCSINVLQNLIQQLTLLTKKNETCDCDKWKKRRFSDNEDITHGFEIISKSEIEEAMPNDPTAAALALAEANNTQTLITSDAKGDFKMLNDPDALELLRHDIDMNGVIFTTTVGVVQETQTSLQNISSKDIPTISYITTDQSTEADVIDIMNEAQIFGLSAADYNEQITSMTKQKQDKEIQNKPDTCCVCVQNSEKNSFIYLPHTSPKVKKKSSFQENGSYQEDTSQESNACLCDTDAIIYDYEKEDRKRERFLRQKRPSPRTNKPMMKFAEVTPINPYSVERVQEHFDVCPASYSQLLCPNAPYAIPPVKPRPLPPDFKYNQMMKTRQGDDLKLKNKCVRIKRNNLYCTNPNCKSTTCSQRTSKM